MHVPRRVVDLPSYVIIDTLAIHFNSYPKFPKFTISEKNKLQLLIYELAFGDRSEFYYSSEANSQIDASLNASFGFASL